MANRLCPYLGRTVYEYVEERQYSFVKAWSTSDTFVRLHIDVEVIKSVYVDRMVKSFLDWQQILFSSRRSILEK